MQDPLLPKFRRDTFNTTRTVLLILFFFSVTVIFFYSNGKLIENEIASRMGCDGFDCHKKCIIYNRPKGEPRRLLVSRSTQRDLLASAWRKCTKCCSKIYEVVPRSESSTHPDSSGYISAPVSASHTTDDPSLGSTSMSYITAKGSASTSYHSALEDVGSESSSTPSASVAGPSSLTAQIQQSVVKTPKDAPLVSQSESGSSSTSVKFHPGSPYSPAPQTPQTRDSPRNYSPMGLTKPLSFTVKIRAQVFGPRPGTWKWQTQVDSDTTFDMIIQKARKLVIITGDTALDIYDIYGHKLRVKYKDVEHTQVVNVVKLPARIEMQHIVT